MTLIHIDALSTKLWSTFGGHRGGQNLKFLQRKFTTTFWICPKLWESINFKNLLCTYARLNHPNYTPSPPLCHPCTLHLNYPALSHLWGWRRFCMAPKHCVTPYLMVSNTKFLNNVWLIIYHRQVVITYIYHIFGIIRRTYIKVYHSFWEALFSSQNILFSQILLP